MRPPYSASSFSISCSNQSQNSFAMATVRVYSQVELDWLRPFRSTDGSALNDLAGFRLHYGTDPDALQVVDIKDPDATSHTLTLLSGTWYFTMTAYDSAGNESRFSNVIEIIAP